MISFYRIQDEKTKVIKQYKINDIIVSCEYYNEKFDKCNKLYNYSSSATKRNIKTGDYIHTNVFS